MGASFVDSWRTWGIVCFDDCIILYNCFVRLRNMSTSESAQSVHNNRSICPQIAEYLPPVALETWDRLPLPRNTTRFTADCRSGSCTAACHSVPPNGKSRALAVMQLTDNTFPTDTIKRGSQRWWRRLLSVDYNDNWIILLEWLDYHDGSIKLRKKRGSRIRLVHLRQHLETPLGKLWDFGTPGYLRDIHGPWITLQKKISHGNPKD